jgi:hypothetical protein
MTSFQRIANLEQSLAIFLDELIADDEFRDSFLRNPRRTLRLAADRLPLSETEVQSLIACAPWVWEKIADDLDSRLQEAA